MPARMNYRRNARVPLDQADRKKLTCRFPDRRPRLVVAAVLLASALSLFWGLPKWDQALSGAAQETVNVRATAASESPKIETAGQPASVVHSANVSALAAPSPVQGPAIGVPREIIEMLDQRKQELDRREESLRVTEERLLVIKAEIEQVLAKYEKAMEAEERRRKEIQAKLTKAEQERTAERRDLYQKQLAKMYESMEPEEAAARLEKLPDRQAVEILRLIKGKTAGAILANVNPARAAHLTTRLLATP
ncbi:MAG: hypothetical protein AB1555_09800 [Nitrospirota bacterium]